MSTRQIFGALTRRKFCFANITEISGHVNSFTCTTGKENFSHWKLQILFSFICHLFTLHVFKWTIFVYYNVGHVLYKISLILLYSKYCILMCARNKTFCTTFEKRLTFSAKTSFRRKIFIVNLNVAGTVITVRTNKATEKNQQCATNDKFRLSAAPDKMSRRKTPECTNIKEEKCPERKPVAPKWKAYGENLLNAARRFGADIESGPTVIIHFWWWILTFAETKNIQYQTDSRR